MKPFIGQIVHYFSRGSADGVYPSVARAAIVTDMNPVEYTSGDGLATKTNDFQVKLTVFNPEGNYLTGWLDRGNTAGLWNNIEETTTSAPADTLATGAAPSADTVEAGQ